MHWGYPRTIGDEMSLEKMVLEGCLKNDNYRRVVHTNKISIVGDGLIDIHRRVVHK